MRYNKTKIMSKSN